jgi:predicted amidohydrolase
MATFETVRVAAIQATSVVLDADATIDKAIGLLEDAAEAGAQLAVLPECFVSLYPDWTWTAVASADRAAFDELYARMWEESVTIPGPRIDRLAEACSRTGIHCVVGVNERDADGTYTLYNSFVVLGPSGVLHVHRKLMPTKHERMFHGLGDGTDLRVVETPFGRVGGLICWENRMPLARYQVYRGAPQIWVAPTADTSDGWIALMQTIAIESGAHVIGAPQYVERAAFPTSFPTALPDGDVYMRGGAAVVDPRGEVLAGPLYGAEGMVLADCDLRAGLRTRAWFDPVGHYARDDVLLPLLSRPAPPPVTADSPAPALLD